MPPPAPRARYGVPSFASHTELLAAIRPDVVHITTPHDQHVQPAIDALAAGVHVVVEKPVAQTCEEAERLVAAAEQPGAPKIAVCFQNRYNATSRRWPRCSPPASSGGFWACVGQRSAGTAHRRTTSPGRGAARSTEAVAAC